MKRSRILWGALLAVLLLGAQALAWIPPRGGCAAIPPDVVCRGNPVNIRGQIVNFFPGQGVVLQVSQRRVAVCGIGPIWYWRQAGLLRRLSR